MLAALKPAFIHHPESKRHLRAILVEHGCDPELTYFDVPRLRTSTSDDYLTTGIAYAFHPHRDTWYSAPMMQLNWWLPIYDVAPDNVVAFHPEYFDQGGRQRQRPLQLLRVEPRQPGARRRPRSAWTRASSPSRRSRSTSTRRSGRSRRSAG